MKYFNYEKWDKCGKDGSWDEYVKRTERVTVSWMTIEEGYRRYIDSNSPKPIDPISGYDVYVDVSPVLKDKIKVIAKPNSSHLHKINGFLKKRSINLFTLSNPCFEHILSESFSDISDYIKSSAYHSRFGLLLRKISENILRKLL